jgi:hypothetical protein
MQGYEFIDYKYKIIQALSKSQPIIALLIDDPNVVAEETDLTDTQILPYHKVPELSDHSLNYIIVSTRVSKIENNKVHSMDTSIYIFVPYTSMKLLPTFARKGSRLDNLIYEVTKLFTGEETFGLGKIQLLPNEAVIPAVGYDGYKVNFRTLDLH